MTPLRMHNFRNPWWPLITTTIPVAILCYIFREAVGLVTDQLSMAQVSAWKSVGVSCASLWILHTIYAAFYQSGYRALDRRYGLSTIAVYAIFLLVCFCGSRERIPEDIQGSVLGEDRLLFAALCLSPTFAHSVMILLLCPSWKSPKIHNLKRSVLGAVAALAIFLIISGGRNAAWDYLSSATLVLIFIAVHYHVVRWTLAVMKNRWWRQAIAYTFKVTAVIAYPLSGVLVNTDILFDVVFRTFAYPGFYLVSIFNGILICLPEPRRSYWRLLLLTLRVITFGFILVLQIMYLPLLPQSAMALASFGLGYIILAPILLAIIKTRMIITDLSFLRVRFARRTMHSAMGQ